MINVAWFGRIMQFRQVTYLPLKELRPRFIVVSWNDSGTALCGYEVTFW